MAGTKIGSLFGDVSLRMAGLDKDIKTFQKKMSKMGKSVTAVGKKLSAGLTLPMAAFGGASIKAFAEQEKAEAGLRSALAASGQEVDGNFQKLLSFASEMQKVTTVGDETSIALAQIGTSMGLSADQMRPALEGAIGLSESFGIEIQTAMRIATGSMQGQTEMLARYVPELRGIKDPAEAAAKAQQAMSDAFEVAKGKAQTTGGQLKQLANAFGDFQESVGSILAQYLKPMIVSMQSVVEKLQNTSPELLKLGVQIGAVLAAAGPFLIILGQLAVALSSSVLWVAGLGVGLGVLLNKFGVLKEAGEKLGEVIVKLFEKDWTGAVKAAAGMMWEILTTFNPIAMAIDFLWQKSRPFWSWFGRQIDHVLRGLNLIFDAFKKVASIPGALGEKLVGAIGNVLYRAEGGPVSSGSPYIVGERGPELFVPRYSGTIVPNHELSGGGGTVIHQHFHAGIGMEIKSFIRNNKGPLSRLAVEAVREDGMRRV